MKIDGYKAFWSKLPMNMNDMSTGNNKRLADTLITQIETRILKKKGNIYKIKKRIYISYFYEIFGFVQVIV